jgi:S-layer homology domain
VMSADPNLNALLAAHPPRVVYGNPAEGPSGPQAPAPNEAWGGQQGATWIAATQFVRAGQTSPILASSGPAYFYAPGAATPQLYLAQLTVEPGRRINRITCAYRDNSGLNDVAFSWAKFTTNVSTGASTQEELDSFITSGAPGYGFNSLFPPAGEETMHVYDGALSVINHYIFAQVAADTFFAGCWVFHQRQVAPGPASATFSDVPRSSPWFPYVEALADTGVTGGCAPGMYCPNDPVTRGQMATFLAKALGMGFPF